MITGTRRCAAYRKLALCAFTFTLPAWGQISIDWAAKRLISYPPIVNDRVSTQVIVTNVNDLLYSYEINLIGTPRLSSDAANLLGSVASAADAAAKAGARAKDACPAALSAMDANVAALANTISRIFDCKKQTTTDGKPRSVPVADTIADWNKTAKPLIEKLNAPDQQQGSMSLVIQQCSAGAHASAGELALARARTTLLQASVWQQRVDAPHRVVQDVTLNAETDYEVIVVERCDQVETARFNAKFSPSSNTLTLSLGSLLSRIEQRNYASAKDPQNTTRDLLSVNGTGKFSPLGVAMLNYRLPHLSTKGEEFGLSLSSGLVLRFGGSEVNASALGFFAGPSVHLFHRLFFTVGAHFGQFSDFPPGLIRGSTIPANYGSLNGVTRSTTRFGFAISFRTTSFVRGSTQATTSTANSAAGKP